METLSLKDAYIQKYGDSYNSDWFPDFDTAFESAWKLFGSESDPEPEIIDGMYRLWPMRSSSEPPQVF